MKLRTVCMLCFKEQGQPSDEAIEIEFAHGGKLIGKCSKGHEEPIGVQEHDFQILFDLGCMAMLDGYSREAVTSIAAALERAYLFYISCVLSGVRKRDGVAPITWKVERSDDERVPEPKLTEELQDFFLSQISKQSERQLGAFLVMYTLHERERPPLLANKWIEFRNNCVHKGTIPPRLEVMKYAEVVLKIMDQLVSVLTSKHADGLLLETYRHLVSARIEDSPRTTMSIPTIVSFNRGSSGGEFSTRLEGLARYRKGLWIN